MSAAPLRLVQIGAGNMGREWLKTVAADPGADIVGIVDVDQSAARRGAELLPNEVVLGDDLREVVERSGAEAVLDVAIPSAHHAVTTEALFLGLPVLGEKPVASTLSEALSLAAASEVTGRLFMVSQSRRYNRQVTAIRRLLSEVAPVGIASCEFFKAPHFGGFREQMDDVLLVDMSIHAFDGVRWMLGEDPVSVYCESFSPSWSWFDGDAAATAVFDFADGTRFTYTGSWCSPGLETSWNGEWRFSAEGGSVSWNGDDDPTAEDAADRPIPIDSGDDPQDLAGSLAAFVAVVGGAPLAHGEVHENITSLAMVEAAVASKNAGQRVRIDDVLERAWSTAIADERRDDVRDRLRSWSSASAGLAAGAAS